MDKLIISTMLKLVYWDGSQAHIIQEGILGDGVAHYHGITWDDAGVMYVTGALDFQYVLYKFQLPSFQELGVIHGVLHELHQIFWYNGKIYVTNTGKNRIEIWQDDSWRSVAWNPRPSDIEHINAIWSDGENFYVAEHRQAATGISIVRICTMDLDHVETVLIGPGIHNVYREGNCLYNLVSPVGGDPAVFIITDMKDRSQCRIDKPEWGEVFVRGLARTQDSWYVGLSFWESDRSKRHVGDAIVVQLDNDFNDLDRVVLKNYGPLCDIRILGAKSLSHNGIVMDI